MSKILDAAATPIDAWINRPKRQKQTKIDILFEMSHCNHLFVVYINKNFARPNSNSSNVNQKIYLYC